MNFTAVEVERLSRLYGNDAVEHISLRVLHKLDCIGLIGEEEILSLDIEQISRLRGMGEKSCDEIIAFQKYIKDKRERLYGKYQDELSMANSLRNLYNDFYDGVVSLKELDDIFNDAADKIEKLLNIIDKLENNKEK